MKNLQEILQEAFDNNIDLNGEVNVEDLKADILEAMTDACVEVVDEIQSAYLDSEDGELDPIIEEMFSGVE